MSTIQRNITLSSIEPAPLSCRTPSRMETWLAVNFFTQDGQVYNQDLAAQLHLTGKSSGRTVSYAMPATDMVNGKARAVIPMGDLTDMNGYRIRLFGTWKQQPWLLATGTMALLPSAGVDAMPDDVIDYIALSFVRDTGDYVDVALWHDAGKTNPFDIASVTVIAPITLSQGGPQLDTFTVTKIGYNEVRLSLTAEQTLALPALCWWTLIVSSGAGQQTMAQGPVSITG